MKLMIASDIHGSAYYCSQMLEAYDREEADRLLLLGDVLYHGPRNDLPKEYKPKEVIAMLNARKNDILCVRGNCDTEVDQMVLEFPVLAGYAVIADGDTVIYATHGHVYNENNLPPIKNGDVLLCGHTHVPVKREHAEVVDYDGNILSPDFIYMNPGSVSIPKEDSWHGYMIYEDGEFAWKDLSGEVRM